MIKGRWTLIGKIRVYIPNGKTVAEVLNVHESDFYVMVGDKKIRNMVQIVDGCFISLDGFRHYYGEPLKE